MFARYLMMFAVMFVLGACSTPEREIIVDETEVSEREAISGGPLSDIYGEDLANPGAGTQAGLIAAVGDRVFFGYDRYDLSQESQTILNMQAEWLAKYPNVNVTVEGHADERGTREYNLALGERRANSVRNYLVALGVSSAKINTISYGKERPAVAGSNESAWAENRRGVLIVE